MPSRFASIGLFVSLMAIVFATNQANDGVASTSRTPASLSKDQILGFKTGPLLRHTEKIRGPLHVNLEMLSGQPSVVGETFVLRGVISSRRPLESASYTWNVPPTIEVLSGTLSGSITSVDADHPGVVELILRKKVADNTQIHLIATSQSHNQRFSDTAQYNTDIQELLTARKKKMRKATESEVKAQSLNRPKIFH